MDAAQQMALDERARERGSEREREPMKALREGKRGPWENVCVCVCVRDECSDKKKKSLYVLAYFHYMIYSCSKKINA